MISTDALLAFDPLNIDHVKRCNQAEAEFWASNEGYQTRPSDELLQFDCGGQVNFPVQDGRVLKKPNYFLFLSSP